MGQRCEMGAAHLNGVSFDALMGSPSPMCGSSGIVTTALKPPPLPPPPATAVTVYSGFAPAAQTPPEHASASNALGRRPGHATAPFLCNGRDVIFASSSCCTISRHASLPGID